MYCDMTATKDLSNFPTSVKLWGVESISLCPPETLEKFLKNNFGEQKTIFKNEFALIVRLHGQASEIRSLVKISDVQQVCAAVVKGPSVAIIYPRRTDGITIVVQKEKTSSGEREAEVFFVTGQEVLVALAEDLSELTAPPPMASKEGVA